MSTSMADTLEYGDPPFNGEINVQQLEKIKFNTGPKAPKHFPSSGRTFNGDHVHSEPDANSMDNHIPAPMDAGLGLQPFSEDSLDQDGPLRFAHPPPVLNECSNLSSAGSVSDREPEGTPGRKSVQKCQGEKKTVRKRRRGDETTPKVERKITEYIKTQSSPKRFASMPNGDRERDQYYYGDNSNPVPGPNSWGGGSSPVPMQHSTPTPMYSSDSNSNSNLSPPGRLRSDVETQTVTVVETYTSEDIAKRDKALDEARRQLDDTGAKLAIEKRKFDATREIIKRLLMEKNAFEKKELRAKTQADIPRIGEFRLLRQGDSFKEQWIDGYAVEELNKKLNAINQERIELKNASDLLKKRKPLGVGKEGAKRSAQNSLTAQLAAVQNDNATPSTSNSNDDSVFRRPEEPKEISIQEYYELDEIYKLRRDHLKKEESDLTLEREKLDRERQLHLRELKRANNERDSRYNDHEMLHSRYLLLSLLGKGGFSEVWRAYDLDENRYVALKIHHVNKEWKEEKKANYVKHAMREKDIHKTLDHCRIVKQFDPFTIDNHSFCTVLDYCPGSDLDFYLKQNKQISEKEARSVIMQVVSALVYLNEKKPPIIHYDLKPANILLESGTACGAIKITDFGLSKIMEGESCDDGSIELTSQFAGTYWYLPPETFVVSHLPPKISSKVDVWSVGVIFYQCIYGRRPFGHEQTQQRILEENTIIKATEVMFPPKPQVSLVAQDFIRRCLQYRKEDRADVFELARHELFRPRGTKPPSSPSIPRSIANKSEEDY